MCVPEVRDNDTSNDKRICQVAAPSEQSEASTREKRKPSVPVVGYGGYFLLRGGCAGSICHGGGLNVGAGDTVEVLANEYRTEEQEGKKEKVPRTSTSNSKSVPVLLALWTSNTGILFPWCFFSSPSTPAQ